MTGVVVMHGTMMVIPDVMSAVSALVLGPGTAEKDTSVTARDEQCVRPGRGYRWPRKGGTRCVRGSRSNNERAC